MNDQQSTINLSGRSLTLEWQFFVYDRHHFLRRESTVTPSLHEISHEFFTNAGWLWMSWQRHQATNLDRKLT